VTDNGLSKTLARASTTGRKALPSPQFAGILVAAHPVGAFNSPAVPATTPVEDYTGAGQLKPLARAFRPGLAANKSRYPGLRAPAVRCWPPLGIMKSSKEPVKLTMRILCLIIGLLGWGLLEAPCPTAVPGLRPACPCCHQGSYRSDVGIRGTWRERVGPGACSGTSPAVDQPCRKAAPAGGGGEGSRVPRIPAAGFKGRLHQCLNPAGPVRCRRRAPPKQDWA
jgi:hypothetical protein